MACPGPVNAFTILIMSDTVAHTGRLQPFPDPHVGKFIKPFAAAADMHGEHILVDETGKIDPVVLDEEFHDLDDIKRAVITDVAAKGKTDIILPFRIRLDDHVSYRAQMPSIAADKTTTETPVQIDPAFGSKSIFTV